MKPQSDMHSADDIPWTEIGAGASSAKGKGVTEKILSQDPDHPEYMSRLVKLEKGVRSDEIQRHPFWEEVWMLKGKIVDEGNGLTATEGYYACRHPGMPHGPFHVEEEAMTFEVHYMPKE